MTKATTHFTAVLLFIAYLRPVDGVGQEEVVSPKASVPKITVLDDEWGGAPPSNIRAICLSVAREMSEFFPQRTFEPIVISRSQKSPITLYAKTEDGQRQVKLNVSGQYWAQFSYQFGHEFGHILCNYRDAKNPQLWFEESLCEAASIFAIQQMSKSWRERPPYSNWKDYAPALATYAENYRRDTERLGDKSFAEWYAENQQRFVEFDRDAFKVVAVYALLPLLDQNPQHWEALNGLNQWDPKQELTFDQYLADWKSRVPEKHQGFVQEVAEVFGIDLSEVTNSDQ